MKAARSKSSSLQRRPGLDRDGRTGASPWRRLTQAALVLALALVCCRVLMRESIRSPLDVLGGVLSQPGSGSADLTEAPDSPGPGTGLALDLLMCVPALLVLARRAGDRSYRLGHCWSILPMALLAVLALASARWAADRFAAIVSASHLFAALFFLWSVSQLVRSFLHLRLVAGVCVGLLLALASTGYNFRLLELHDQRDAWEQNKKQILKAHEWKPGSVEAQMFENRVLKGQPMGFSTSPNTYAALLVMLGLVTAGVVIQRRADGDHWGWIVVPVVALIGIPPLIRWTLCRAAYATPIMGAMILLGIWLVRPWLARFSRAAYALGIAGIALLAGVVVEHGLHTGKLWHESLTFRWQYWVGSYKVLMAGIKRPMHEYFNFFLGVGWENFGPFYLGHRLGAAREEIRDPHNFVVRVFVELGIVGGLLLLAWMLRLWWELTRPVLPAGPGEEDHAAVSRWRPWLALGSIAGLAIVLNVFSAIDLNANGWYVLVELLKRPVFGAMLVIGMIIAALRGRAERESGRLEMSVELDHRAAPWVLYAILAALATFLVHNLIEFSLFEPGPMSLFALLTGAALGIRAQGQRQPSAAARDVPSRIPAIIALSGGAMGWIAAIVLLVAPVAGAESLAAEADSLAFSFNRTHDGRALLQAASTMAGAYRQVPYNADYARRTAELMLQAGFGAREPGEVKQMLDAAVAADPSSAQGYVLRAQFELSRNSNPDQAASDYESALALDPNNVRLRLEFARELQGLAKSLHRPKFAAEAALEYERALDMNNQLAPEEIKRLNPSELADVHHALADLTTRPIDPPFEHVATTQPASGQ